MPQQKLADLLERFKGTRDLATAEVGDSFGTMDFTLTEDMVERIAWSVDDYHPWYLEGSPFGGRIGSPLALLPFDGGLFWGAYRYPAEGSLLAEQEYEFIRPLLVGGTYRMSGTMIRKERKRGRTYYTMGVSIVDADGREVMRSAKTCATPVTPAAAE